MDVALLIGIDFKVDLFAARQVTRDAKRMKYIGDKMSPNDVDYIGRHRCTTVKIRHVYLKAAKVEQRLQDVGKYSPIDKIQYRGCQSRARLQDLGDYFPVNKIQCESTISVLHISQGMFRVEHHQWHRFHIETWMLLQ